LADVREIRGSDYAGVDLLAGGVPCPPFSIAGRQLGHDDERDLFCEVIRLAAECHPKSILVENVRGFADSKFAGYRDWLFRQLEELGFAVAFKVLDAANYGVPQRRARSFLVGLDREHARGFSWPVPSHSAPTVARAIGDLMSSRGWKGAEEWSKRAQMLAPTLVGGSKKHGGPDLGPTRAKKQWALLGVDGHGVADEAPGRELPTDAAPRLTVRMAARLQCFPDDWEFCGRKTAAYRQVGNALPPPLAAAVGREVKRALLGETEGFSALPKQPELMPLSAPVMSPDG
jgi:DNA (cytosine-5)-methyltransferase 1